MLKRAITSEWILFAGAAGYFLWIVIDRPADFQWDFQTYLDSAHTLLAGLNPYDRNSGLMWEYVYQPVTLWFFVPFTWLDPQLASNIWLFLKIGLLCGLMILWRTEFLRAEGDGIFYLFVLFAFHGTVYLDLRAGNISIIEQALIWVGCWFYLQRKLWLFCVCIIAAALFKVTPILLLFALWFSEAQSRRWYFFGALTVFAGIVALNFVGAPEFFATFQRNARGHVETTSLSNLHLIRATFQALKDASGIVVAEWVQLSVYGAAVAAVSLAVLWTRTALRANPDRERIGLFVTCFAYTLVLPNLGDYGYILLIAPTYYILRRAKHLGPFVPLLFLAVVSPAHKLPRVQFFSYVWDFQPVLVAYGMLGVYLYEIYAAQRGVADQAYANARGVGGSSVRRV